MFLEKNLNLCKQHRPELYQVLTRTAKTGRYQVIASQHAKKVPNLIDTLTKQAFYDNTDPLGDVERQIRSKNISVPELCVMFGFGLGYHMLAYANQHNSSELCIMVVEPNPEVVLHAFERVDYAQFIVSPNVEFIVGADLNTIFPTVYQMMVKGNRKFYAKAVNVVDVPASFGNNKEYFLQFFKVFKDAMLEILHHYGNDPADSLIGIEHTFLNIHEILHNPGIRDLKDAFKGKPGLVVSAGPSLDKNIRQLIGNEHKFVIAAPDASMRIMKKYGLKPNFVTCLERVVATSKLFDDITPEDCTDVVFAPCPVIRPETYANFKGDDRISVYRNFATFQWLDIDRGTLDIGPSAGNMAFKILEYMGCDPIILIGQDLAFAADDRSHADGSFYGQRQEWEYKRQRLEVPGNYEPTVKTNEVWFRFLKFYERDAAMYKGTLINATEGGARIPNTKISTFAEVLEQYAKEEFDVIGTVRSLLEYPTPEQVEENRQKVLDKVEHGISYLKGVIDTYSDVVEACLEFDRTVTIPHRQGLPVDAANANALFQRSQKAMKILSDSDFFLIMMHYVQSYVIKTIVNINGMKAQTPPGHESDIKTVQMIGEMANTMIGLTRNMLHLFENLRIRLQEEGAKAAN